MLCSADADAIQDNAILQPSQRITPYMNKATARPVSLTKHQTTPASSTKFRERAQSGAVQAVLNAGIQQPDFAEVTRLTTAVPMHVQLGDANAFGPVYVSNACRPWRRTPCHSVAW